MKKRTKNKPIEINVKVKKRMGYKTNKKRTKKRKKIRIIKKK